ncbi:MAG: hypothetical protein O3B95_02775 [Chloroflexi bacterium]|nr:hypothetical protein [Chloroflexota bacterium]
MTNAKFPAPPDYWDAEPQMMTARELREALEDLWEWVDRAESVHEDQAPPIRLIEDVRTLMRSIITERVERHSEEPGRTAE